LYLIISSPVGPFRAGLTQHRRQALSLRRLASVTRQSPGLVLHAAPWPRGYILCLLLLRLDLEHFMEGMLCALLVCLARPVKLLAGALGWLIIARLLNMLVG
jgi:hypothetical protein